MNQAPSKRESLARRGGARARTSAPGFRASVLDTYKQTLQAPIHAGFKLFDGFPKTLFPRGIYELVSEAMRAADPVLSCRTFDLVCLPPGAHDSGDGQGRSHG